MAGSGTIWCWLTDPGRSKVFQPLRWTKMTVGNSLGRDPGVAAVAAVGDLAVVEGAAVAVVAVVAVRGVGEGGFCCLLEKNLAESKPEGRKK